VNVPHYRYLRSLSCKQSEKYIDANKKHDSRKIPLLTLDYIVNYEYV
jgi:hypothetical protein